MNIRQGITTPGKFYDLMDSQEWADRMWLEIKNKYNSDHDVWVRGGSVGKEPTLVYNNAQFGTGTHL